MQIRWALAMVVVAGASIAATLLFCATAVPGKDCGNRELAPDARTPAGVA